MNSSKDQARTKATVRSGRTQAERSEHTKRLLLKTSAKLVRKYGVGGLRTADVAAAAGVSQGAQFHHFPNKEALVLATLEFVNAEMVGRTRKNAQLFDVNDDPIKAIIVEAQDFFMGDYFFVELGLGLNAEGNTSFMRRIREQVRAARFEVEEIWKARLRVTGLSPQLSDDIVDLTFNMVRGLAVRSLLSQDKKRFEELGEIWRTMMRLYIGHVSPAGEVAAAAETAPGTPGCSATVPSVGADIDLARQPIKGQTIAQHKSKPSRQSTIKLNSRNI